MGNLCTDILRKSKKFEKISHFVLTLLLNNLKIRRKIFVAFSQYLNFIFIDDIFFMSNILIKRKSNQNSKKSHWLLFNFDNLNNGIEKRNIYLKMYFSMSLLLPLSTFWLLTWLDSCVVDYQYKDAHISKQFYIIL